MKFLQVVILECWWYDESLTIKQQTIADSQLFPHGVQLSQTVGQLLGGVRPASHNNLCEASK